MCDAIRERPCTVAVEFNEKVDDSNIRLPSMNVLPSKATKKTNFEGQYVNNV